MVVLLAQINGTYTWQSDVWNGRPTYKQAGTETPLYLYFLGEKRAWAISNDIGCNLPHAFVEDLSATPDRVSNVWQVMDIEVPYVRGKSVDTGGSYAPDHGVLCSQSSMLALIGSGALQTSKNPRTNKITALLASQASLDKQLETALQGSNMLRGEMEGATFALIFGQIQDIGRANYTFFDSLVQARNIDPAFDQPVAQLLFSALVTIKAAYTAYCTGLGTKLATLRDALAKNPQYREKIGHPDKLLNAVEAPFLQAQRYPHFVNAILAATNTDRRPGAQEDAEGLPQVLSGFAELQKEVMAAAQQSITMEDLNRSMAQEAPEGPAPVLPEQQLAAPPAPVQAVQAVPTVTLDPHFVSLTLPVGFKFNVKNNGDVLVTSVSPGSPADRASVEKGMQLVSVNGERVAGLPKQDITAMIKASTPQGKIKVVLTNFDSEFRSIDKKKAPVDHLPGPWEALMHTCRYQDVIPNRHSRVKLQQIGDNILTTFVNANHTRAWNGTPNWYIAAQGPKPETVVDFWRMIWEQRTDVVVMTTGIVENGRPKCSQYWPFEPTDPAFECGQYTVATLSTKRVGEYLFTQIQVSCADEVREIGHFWYDTWPDHGAPAKTKGVADMLRDVEAYSAGGPERPWVVHCSAGLGRTGTFIGIHMGMQQLDAEGVTHPKSLMIEMREDRGGTIQAAVQANFMQGALNTYALSLDRICEMELVKVVVHEPEQAAAPPTMAPLDMDSASNAAAVRLPPQNPSQPVGPPKNVTIKKSNASQALGLSMESTPNGVYITALVSGKLAQRTGELVPGMLVLKINGKTTANLSEQQRRNLVVGSQTVVLSVQYDPIGHEAARCALYKWYHGIKSEQEAALFLKGMKTGTFIGCQCAENLRHFALYVAVKKNSQKFKVTREPDGVFFIDGLSGFDVPEFKSFAEVVQHIYPGPCPDFEVPLTMFLPRSYVPGIGLGGRVERGRGRGRGGRGRGGGQGRGGSSAQAQAETVNAPVVAGRPMTVTVNPSPGDKIGLQMAGPDGGAPGGCFVKLVRPDTPASRAGDLTTGMRLLSLGGVDASMQSKTEVNDYLRQAGATGGPFEMVVKYDPEGYAAYDGGTLFKMEQAMAAAPTPSAGAGEDEEDQYGVAQSFSNKAGHAQAHRKMSMEEMFQEPSQGRIFEVDVPTPLGMAFDGSPSTGYYITKVKPNSNALATGQLKVDMRILDVNGQDLRGIDKKGVTEAIKASDGICKVKVQFDQEGAKNFEQYKKDRAVQKSGDGPTQPASTPFPDAGQKQAAADIYASPDGQAAEVPSTEAPSAEAPSTEAPSTEAPSTEAPKKEGKKKGKKDKKGKKGAQNGDTAVVSVSVTTPLGMSFDGQADKGYYVMVCREGKNAAATGVIVAGQKILSVNGQALDGLDKKGVVSLIKGSPGQCALELLLDPEGFAALNKALADKTAGVGGATPQPQPPAPPPRSSAPVPEYASIDPAEAPPLPTANAPDKPKKEKKEKKAKKKKTSGKGGTGKLDYAADQSWNVGAMGKGAVSALLGKPTNAPGSFVVRNSSQPGKLALSVKDVGGGIRAFLITMLPGGRFEVVGKEANSLAEAITAFAAEVVTSKDTPGATFQLGAGAK